MTEREALVARLQKHADLERDDSYGNPHVEKLCRDAIAALTAPPSGVREGMLGAPMNPAAMIDEAITRAAEQVNAEGPTVGCAEPSAPREHKTVSRSDPSAPTPQPADGVVVLPTSLREDISTDMCSDRWRMNFSHTERALIRDALLAAAKEPINQLPPLPKGE